MSEEWGNQGENEVEIEKEVETNRKMVFIRIWEAGELNKKIHSSPLFFAITKV